MDRTEIDSAKGLAHTQHQPPWRYTLADRQEVTLTYLNQDDHADLMAGFEGLSKQSRYLRFFSAMPALPDFIADGLLNTDDCNHIAIGARLLDQHALVGVARYFRSAENEYVAEPAIAVIDDLHGVGLGKVLLRRLSAVARARGITHFRAQVLNSNRRMRAMLLEAHAVFVDQEDDVLTYEIDIRKSAQAPRGVLAKLLTVMQRSS